MAAAVYSTNLTDLTLSQATTGFTAIGGGGAIAAETDFYIQDGICVSKLTAATWDSAGTARGGVIYNSGAARTIPTDGAVMVWMYWWGPGVLATKANGGAEVIFGNLSTAYYSQYVSGSDDWEFGGWRCYPVDPNLTPRDRTTGAPNGTWQWFGWNANVAATQSIGKGAPYGIDAIRFGRCDLIATDGDLANGYATFLGAANWDNTGTRRLGLLTPMNGVYQQQGLFVMGLAGTPVDFRDSNRVIFIQNTEKVSANFNTFEVRNASSNVSWTAISISALGTVAKGRFVTTDNATVNISNCTFTDMNTFNFLSNATISETTFRRCGLITPTGAVISGSTVEASTATAAIIINTVAEMGVITDTTFNSNNRAINITAAGTYSFDGLLFAGNTYDVENSSTGLVTINASNGSNVSTFINTNGGSTTIVNTKTFTVNNIIADTEIRLIRQSDLVELAGVEVVGASPSGQNNMTVSADADNPGRYKASYSYGYTGDVPIYVVAFNEQYQALYLNNSLKADNSTLAVFQTTDRQYDEGSI
jgi:hypothetical protein